MRRAHRLALTALLVPGIGAVAWLLAAVPAALPPTRVVVDQPRVDAPATTLEAAPGPRIVALFPAPESGRVDVAGFDPAPPRSLVIWQRVGEDVTPIGRVQSDPDGSFAADDLLVSARGGELVAAPVGGDPLRVLAEPVAVAAAASRPAAAWRQGGDLVVGLPARAQRVLLADRARREIGRLEIPASPRRGTTWRRDIESVAPGGEVAWIALEPDAGERPAWHPVPSAARRTQEASP